ncbi:hypothetical protein BRADI_4g06693v3 [Brachypodium distachyon]|uniref:Uncharacterized protein n=1 Tax=Brachypodium distachyon TaxID=15368 RepID=A0A0Q3HEE3_BRADI|nr:hypothetical protein BRADI_4g06693v3 [Brachypodium distachyon]
MSILQRNGVCFKRTPKRNARVPCCSRGRQRGETLAAATRTSSASLPRGCCRRPPLPRWRRAPHPKGFVGVSCGGTLSGGGASEGRGGGPGSVGGGVPWWCGLRKAEATAGSGAGGCGWPGAAEVRARSGRIWPCAARGEECVAGGALR